jgi:hypothetical protein
MAALWDLIHRFRANSRPRGPFYVSDEVDFALSISGMKKIKNFFGGSLWPFLPELSERWGVVALQNGPICLVFVFL